MKRIGYLFEKICSLDNLILAEKKARKGKTKKKEVIEFTKNKDLLLSQLYLSLVNQTFNTSEYTMFKLKEYDKIREIYKLPYFPDRIVHHAILNVLEPIFVRSFISQTYSCIKKRGIHKCLRDLNKTIKNYDYCLKLDIVKFYPSIDNTVLKALLRNKFKDPKLLWLLDDIINSNKGQAIGNYISQYFGNYYLSGLDHYCKEVIRLKAYYRYCDDIVILGSNKEQLRDDFNNIKAYLTVKLKLEIKSNYQIFPIESRGIDFVGYVSYKTHINLRKRIKKRFIEMIKTNLNKKSIASYNGWLQHCDSVNLRNKYLNYANN